MNNNRDIYFSVYKGLQRPIVFKGLKGVYIYYAFGLAIASLFVSIIVSTLSNFLYGCLAMAITAFGGIIGMAIYQRKYGLYRKNTTNGIFIVYRLLNKN